jgi:5-methylcytosine-specific restriction protein A
LKPPNARQVPRQKTAQRGYGGLWQRLRLMVLREEPLCRECKKEGQVTEAKHVDHVLPIAQGGTNERSNLQSLCAHHHAIKTATEDGGFGRVPVKSSSMNRP